MAEKKEFRWLNKDFLNELKNGYLKCILAFEKKFRKAFLVEIRKNSLDLYFLGHAISVTQTNKSDYYLNGSSAFQPDGFDKWPIPFKNIKAGRFEQLMYSVMSKIILHKKGAISEGVSEINHYVNNRALDNGGIMIIDRQVAFGGSRIDLLGLKKIDRNNLSFVVIELKNKENKEIEKVFSQTKKYLDILWDNYDSFKATYDLILDQKIKLGLLARRNKGIIIPKDSVKDKIEGIVILDNYNTRSGYLKRALDDWKKISRNYDFKLFLKTNVLDRKMFLSYNQAREFNDTRV